MKNNSNKNINIKDLAKKLNLSVSSVSRALNGYDNISTKTTNRIIRAAQKYNYIPNLAAKRLASKKSDTIAFISAITPSAPDYVLLEFPLKHLQGILTVHSRVHLELLQI